MEIKKSRKVLWISLAILIILILAFCSFKYIQITKRKSYIQGGNDAINQIITLAKESGGITLKENEDSTIALALYEKEIVGKVIDEPPAEDIADNSTNSSA